ncbi:Fic family protein [Numidum massiliense]|uniref:Fic family protein n=1 Tax=Numidum massiliense TaxID=1522315 RepID=UPI00093DF585|nr:Fic family protein [Numidum massiliense]
MGAPQQTFDRKDLFPTVIEKAAALMRSLIKNHPFHNGNKRTEVVISVKHIARTMKRFTEYQYVDRSPHKKLLDSMRNIAKKH